jgi:hypothetical protein
VGQPILAAAGFQPAFPNSAHPHKAGKGRLIDGRRQDCLPRLREEKAKRLMRAHLQTCEKAFTLPAKVAKAAESLAQEKIARGR